MSGTAAARAKRYRARLRKGAQIVPIEVDGPLVDALLARYLIAPQEAADRDAIARALRRLAMSDGKERIRRLYGAGGCR